MHCRQYVYLGITIIIAIVVFILGIVVYNTKSINNKKTCTYDFVNVSTCSKSISCRLGHCRDIYYIDYVFKYDDKTCTYRGDFTFNTNEKCLDEIHNFNNNTFDCYLLREDKCCLNYTDVNIIRGIIIIIISCLILFCCAGHIYCMSDNKVDNSVVVI
jgi:hypothetical protein